MKIDEATIDKAIIEEIENMDIKSWINDRRTNKIDCIDSLSYIDGMISLGYELKRLLKE